MRYFIHLGFDGTLYSGWQRQPSVHNTVQETLEKAISQVLKQPTTIYGCGRTDAGVHASQFIAQFDLDTPLPESFKFKLNKTLPHDISIFDVIEAKGNWHCRYNAIERTYDYFIHWKKDPVLLRYSSFYEGIELDIPIMEKAILLIQNHRDFAALCKHSENYNHTLCKISQCKLFVNEEQGRMRFSISADRFVRGMVRYCVSYLLKIGVGTLSVEEFEEVLNQKSDFNRHEQQKQPAPPNGLYLSRVVYPAIDFQSPHYLIKMLKSGLE